jgi:hypothetical protein
MFIGMVLEVIPGFLDFLFLICLTSSVDIQNHKTLELFQFSRSFSPFLNEIHFILLMSSSKPCKPPSVLKGTGNEAKRVQQRLRGFDWETSDAWIILREHFGPTIQTNEIRSVAYLLCSKLPDLKLDRDAARDGRVLIKWYQENLAIVRDNLKYVDFRDSSGAVIGRQEV